MSKLNHLHNKKKSSKKISQSGYHIVLIFIISLGTLVLIQAFRWQIIKGNDFISMASLQYANNQKELPQRGMILASDDTILAVDEPVWTVYASLSSDNKEREEFFEKKSELIE